MKKEAQDCRTTGIIVRAKSQKMGGAECLTNKEDMKWIGNKGSDSPGGNVHRILLLNEPMFTLN